MANMKRVSFTLPPEVVDDLSYVCQRVGVSRSSLVAEVLSGALTGMASALRDLPLEPTERDLLRYRGASKQVIDERLDAAQRIATDLFSDLPSDGGGNDKRIL